MILFIFMKFIIFLQTCMCVGWWCTFFLIVSWYMSYLLPHNNYFKTYLLKTTSICYLTICKCKEFRSNLARWFWFRVSHQVAVKMSARAVIWRLYGDWRIYIQDGSLTWLESWCWLLVVGHSSSLCGPLCRVAWVSLQYGSGIPQRKQPKRARQKWQCLLWPSFRNHIPSLLP